MNNATAALNDMERELDKNKETPDSAGREMDDVADSADDMVEELDDAGDSAEKSRDKFKKLGSVLKGIGAVAVAAGGVERRRKSAAAPLSLRPGGFITS